MTHAESHPEPLRPHKVLAERVRKVRGERGLTGAGLAERMTEAGIKWDRSVVANLENGRRASVSVEELLALAYVLDVAPVHLVVPITAGGCLSVTPDVSVTNEQARAWIRGDAELPGKDGRKYFSEVPEDEWKLRAGQQEEALRQTRPTAPGGLGRGRVSSSTGTPTRQDPWTGQRPEPESHDDHGT